MASKIKSFLPVPEFLNKIFAKSSPSSERTVEPISEAIEFRKSICETISSET